MFESRMHFTNPTFCFIPLNNNLNWTDSPQTNIIIKIPAIPSHLVSDSVICLKIFPGSLSLNIRYKVNAVMPRITIMFKAYFRNFFNDWFKKNLLKTMHKTKTLDSISVYVLKVNQKNEVKFSNINKFFLRS